MLETDIHLPGQESSSGTSALEAYALTTSSVYQCSVELIAQLA